MPSLPEVPALPADGVLLHVGVHKTGTTALQAALADARPQLRERGILYPGKRSAQHRQALAVTQRTWGWKERGGESYDMKYFDSMARQVRKHPGRVAVSSEFFCECDAPTAAKVVADLGGPRVHVVVTLRNLGRLLPSSWQQYLKYGLVADYDKWLRNVFSDDKGHMTPSFWRRNDHAGVIQRWAEALGPHGVTVLVLEGLDHQQMYRTFAQLLDLPEDVLVSRMSLTSNRSMTAAEAEFLIRLNRRVKKEMTWDEYVRFVRRGVALGMVEGREPAPDEPRLHTPDWALDAAAERGAESVDRIRELGVRVLGDLDALGARVDSPPPPPASASTELPTDAAVQAVMTVIEMTRENPELSARELGTQLISRAKGDVRTRWRLKSLRP
ncbi:MAG: hypothetical protein ACYC2Z_07950 [Candidatus Nanopelagicales bacterium]